MSSKAVRFSEHARTKFEVLRRHGFSLDEKTVINIASSPDAIFEGYSGRKIAQGLLDESRVPRVIYGERNDQILVITFYPGKRERYEKNKIQ